MSSPPAASSPFAHLPGPPLPNTVNPSPSTLSIHRPPPSQLPPSHPATHHAPRPEQVRIAAYLVNGLADAEAATREETLRHMDALGAEYLHFPAYEEEYRTKVLGA